MSGYSEIHDIGKYIKTAIALAANTITAGAGNDGQEVNGIIIDRQALGRFYESCKISVPFEAILAEGATLTATMNLQTSDSSNFGSGNADLADLFAAAVVATGEAGGSTEQGVIELDVDLAEAKRYIRIQLTLNLSASGTDTVKNAAVAIFGGGEALPAV